MRACDDAFREQLEAKEAAHQAHFSRLEAQMQKDVDLAETKVTAVCFNPSTCTCMHTWTWLRALLYVLILLHVHACM